MDRLKVQQFCFQLHAGQSDRVTDGSRAFRQALGKLTFEMISLTVVSCNMPRLQRKWKAGETDPPDGNTAQYVTSTCCTVYAVGMSRDMDYKFMTLQ